MVQSQITIFIFSTYYYCNIVQCFQLFSSVGKYLDCFVIYNDFPNITILTQKSNFYGDRVIQLEMY